MAELQVIDAGIMAYRAAWDLQLQIHQQVLDGELPAGGAVKGEGEGVGAGALILVEHPPTITIGRRPNAAQHLRASPKMLAMRGVEVVETDRGGDITFHGPGQLVAYPILNLNTYHLNLHAYLRLLEQVIIDALATFHVAAQRDPSPAPATGVWVAPPATPTTPSSAVAAVNESGDLSKIAAIGIKLRRWTTLHGLALNVTTDLSYFDLINPCGLSRPVTSLQKLLGDSCPAMGDVRRALLESFVSNLNRT